MTWAEQRIRDRVIELLPWLGNSFTFTTQQMKDVLDELDRSREEVAKLKRQLEAREPK